MVIVIVDENTERSAEIAGKLRRVGKIYEAGTPQEIETIAQRTGKVDVFFVTAELEPKVVQALVKRYEAMVFVYGDVAPDVIGDFYRAGAKDLFAYPLETDWVIERVREVVPNSAGRSASARSGDRASVWEKFSTVEDGLTEARQEDSPPPALKEMPVREREEPIPDWKEAAPSAAPERFILLASAKGGEGKTTFAAQLGMLMAKKGERVVLLDIDANGNAADVAGVETVDDISGFAAKRHLNDKDLLSMTALHKPSGLRVLASPAGTFEPLRWSEIKRVVDAYRGLFPHVIVDHTAGITPSLLYLARDYATDVFVMVTPDMSRLQRMIHMLEVMLQQGISARKIRVVVNRTRMEAAYRVIQAAVMDVHGDIPVFSLPYHPGLDGRDNKGLTPIAVSDPKSAYAKAFRSIVSQTLRFSIGTPSGAKGSGKKPKKTDLNFLTNLFGFLKARQH